LPPAKRQAWMKHEHEKDAVDTVLGTATSHK